MPTSHPRIGVTKDPELARALAHTRRLLPADETRSEAGQLRRLALVGARALADESAQLTRDDARCAALGARPAQTGSRTFPWLDDAPADPRGRGSRALGWARGGR